MHPSRLLVSIGAVVVAVSLPLGFLSSPETGRLNGVTGAAWPAAILVAPVLVVALRGDRRARPGAAVVLAGALLAAGATLFGVAKLVDALRAARLLATLGVGASVGPGAWLLPAGTVLVLAGTALAVSRPPGRRS